MNTGFNHSNNDKLLSNTNLLILVLFSLVYLSWTYIFVGFRVDHLIFYLFISTLFIASKHTRKLVLAFVFFIFYWIIYDSMRIYPNYLLNEVHLAEPYEFEKYLFGISSGVEVLSPNEYLRNSGSKILDFLTGVFYLSWVPLPLFMAFYFYSVDRIHMLRFSFVFLLTNLIGFIIYYSYPAAPPWYIDLYGFVEKYDIPGYAAQLLNFDKLIGFPLYENMYDKNANVFAAIPSLHSAYPVVTLYYCLKKKLPVLSLIMFVTMIGIWFSAVYSFHHYIIDVILGVLCAIFGILLFEGFLKNTTFDKLLKRYDRFIGN